MKKQTALVMCWITAATVACSGSKPEDGGLGSGGSPSATGGNGHGGASIGGASIGGASIGGASIGGASIGGASIGGASIGGASIGGASIGGTSIGGASIGLGGATSTGGAVSACSLPACLTALGCAPTGTCAAQDNPDTGNTIITYANGVKQTSVLNLTDYSTALTVTNGTTTCFATAYIGNDFLNAAGNLAVKNASGTTVATLAMDSTSSYYIVTCTGAQSVNVDKSCAKTWPMVGLTTLPASTCTTTGAGGASGIGGATGSSGGKTSTGGTSATGGNAAGGATSVGGDTAIDPGRVRTILPIDRDWRFNQGGATGAEQATFSDSAWRALNVPHDWSIEGPFSADAPTTGRGGYVPAGVAWYRKHFTLPQSLSGRRVYVEFDGVMENSTVYINGVLLGNHPYGYTSFRYDMTANVKFGTADNLLAVKADTSLQPNSRYYAGSGIYRHVRIIATDPVHVDQWATNVTTPNPTTTAATVHVQTSIQNSGSAAASVSLQGVVSDVSGTAVAPVTTPAQTIAAGASASFTFDVPVSSPKLWSPEAPNMYQLLTKVQVSGATVDDDVTPFGIRSLTFSAATGMSINGKATKFKGVCLHQDYHGLGLAAPQRAMQRRLAQLKTYGVNAVRTAHDPPSPEFLDLCDRMGILVMDEFFDVWTARKYSDVGDYAAYFNKTATSPTGMPAVPGATTGTKWYEVDVTGIVMRDRNHPSIGLYSAGNEIRDALATRTPLLTRIIAIAHALDPNRAVTQGLFRPLDSGDVDGATRTLLDVFGGNYRSTEVLQAMATSPTHPGVLTEMGTETATWATVTANPALTGSFMWTGVDYLGESDGAWPTVGSSSGILDEMGTPKTLAFSWQSTWGATKTTFSTGAVAGKVVLTPDHNAITTDLNDASFVKAAVPNATAAVTFSIIGPGVIVAVDSGSQTQESFRGNTRNAYGGLAFAIVQATGPGTITVTAKSTGLTDGTATIQATDGKFVPCSGSCD